MKKLLQLITIIFLCQNLNAQNSWLQKNDFGGTARASALSFSTSSNGYIGFGSGQLSDLWEYDPIADSWTQKVSFPGNQRASAFGFALNDKFYFGGGESSSGQMLYDFWEYNTMTNSWSQKSNLNNLYNWRNTMSTSANGFGVTYKSNRINIYNPINDSWQSILTSAFPQRDNGFSFGIGNSVYLGGGFDGNGNILTDFWSYNLSSNTWSQLPNIPVIQQGPASFVIGNRGYICSGDNTVNMINDVYCFDINLNQWIPKANFIGAGRFASVGFTINNKGYCGTGGNGSINLKDFYEYTPDTITTGFENITATEFNMVFFNKDDQSIHVFTNKMNQEKDYKFEIFNISGAIIPFTKSNSSDEYVLKLIGQQEGICFLRINGKHGFFEKKIILTK